ncbi:MAG TPA: DUF2911 domain-containing protein [Acidobacteriota bacterium]|nr:DUF2911 domain-containing protein [Acidobacteriota bacterium]
MRRAGVGVLFCAFWAAFLPAHQPGEDTTAINLGKGKVTIHYGTPKLGSRNIDEMITPGMFWRIGMNAPTTLTTSVDLSFNGKKLPAGKYSLFAKPGEHDSWALLISSDMKERLDPSTVVLEAPLHLAKETTTQDVLKITLEGKGNEAALTVAWGTYRLHGSFKAA